MKIAALIIAALWAALIIQFPAETRLFLDTALRVVQDWGGLFVGVVAGLGLWLAWKAVSE